MTAAIGRDRGFLGWLHELLFSIYFALLVITVHEEPSLRWSTRLHIYYASHYRPDLLELTDEGYRLYVIAFLLIWVSAAVIFLCLRIFAGFSFTKVVLRTFAGVVALCGFPLASLYYGEGRMLFLGIELIVAAVCALLWAYRKWLISAPLNILLLALHFVLWATFSKFPGVLCCILFWPGWIWHLGSHSGEKIRLIYPLVGFCSTLLWAAYFRQSEQMRLPA